MFIFGCVSIGQGFVKNYSGLLATRFLLGLAEASVFPGCFYLIAMYAFRPSHQKSNDPEFCVGGTSATRPRSASLSFSVPPLSLVLSAVFWPTRSPNWMVRLDWPAGGGCSSSVCLPFLFVAVHLIDSAIPEGLLTVGCAVVVFFLTSNFPEESKWLSDDEKAFVQARLAEDTGDSQLDAHPTWREVLGVLKDFKLVLGGLAYFGLIVPGSSFAYFAPAIVRSLGHSPVMTQLYSVPPWAVSFGLSMAAATASDYYKRKYIFILPLVLISVAGTIVLLSAHDSVSVRYAALFISMMGGFSALPIILCWFSVNRKTVLMASSDFII